MVPGVLNDEMPFLMAPGGTYFRVIDSGTSGVRETEAWKEFPVEWFAGLGIKTHVAASWKNYDTSVRRPPPPSLPSYTARLTRTPRRASHGRTSIR